MTQTERLYEELKRLLKSHGLTYRDVAAHLAVSNASVKRLFAEQTLSLPRIEATADLLGMTLAEIIKSAEARDTPIDELSQNQEEALVSDVRLLMVGICVTNRWSFETILAHYQLTEHELIQLLAKLDKLNIIELLPRNHYRLRVSRNFRWRTNGPLQKFFFQTVLQDFFSPRQDENKSYFRMSWGLVAPEDMEEIKHQIDRLASEYVSVTEQSPYHEGKQASTLLISFRRDWQPLELRSAKRVVD
tara:strand:- start:59119 stop:59856 length:738 start_codon:yes stop_codon:yes gene_type:complete